jgi:hypothetical protein
VPEASDPEPADHERRALGARAHAARDHAGALGAYEADLAVVRRHADPSTAGAGCAAAATGLLDARERVTHLAVMLDALARVHDGRATPADRRLLAAARRPHAVTPRPSVDAVRALLADAAGALAPRAERRSEHHLGEASPAELTILGDLLDWGITFDQLVQLLDGAHLLVPGHFALDRWSALAGVHPRTSSHYRDLTGPDAGPQYGLAGTYAHEILFGPGPHGSTFVQLERAAPSPTALPRHLADWVEYRASRRNQGPYGSSAFTDARPLHLALADHPEAVAPSVAAGRVREIATAVGTTARVIEPELALTPLVARVPAAPAYDDALRATVAAFGAASDALRAVAVELTS